MVSYSLKKLASMVDGEIIGDSNVTISGVAGIKEASPGEITFLANPKYESYLNETRAAAIITNRKGKCRQPVLKVNNPYMAFLKVVKLFYEKPLDKYPRRIHPTAVVPSSTVLGEDVHIGAYAVIGGNAVIGDRTTVLSHTCISEGVTIGKECVIYPQVTIREGCKLDDRVIVHAGAVIGSDGFGYAKDGNTHQKIPQIGIVHLEDDVEVGANSTVDRATTGVTMIKSGSKIDNLVQIAHNVVVGENSILAAQVGVSGSTELGKNVVLAGQAGLVGHIKIGNGARVGAQGGVTKSIPPETSVSGYPAREHQKARRIYAASARLPKLVKELRTLKKRVEELELERENGSSAEDH